MERNVYVERSKFFLSAYHWAVKVGDDFYEIGVAGGKKGKTNSINGDPEGKPNSRRVKRPGATLQFAGKTKKTSLEILEFNRKWIKKNPKYNLLTDNCQSYTVDLVQFLVGDFYSLPIPQACIRGWASGPHSHDITTSGYSELKATTGKAGGQLAVFAAEVEGPMASLSGADDAESGNVGMFAEASLARVEAKVGPARVRLQPNINSGIGVKDGQRQLKVLGFGISVGSNGLGVCTPIGSVGFGNY